MRITQSGILRAGAAGTDAAVLTFPALCRLHDGTMLATCRAGRGKDGADERIILLRSRDGEIWEESTALPPPPPLDGRNGSLKLCYLTEIRPGHLIAAAMWVDRTTHPGADLFNPETEGCLPMAILLTDSSDGGHSFTPWRRVPMPAEIGPPSLTSPLLALPDGSLVMGIETNKTWDDTGPWAQRAVHFRSHDDGQTWGAPETVAEDPTRRIFNWDLRHALWPDGGMASFAWTFDRQDGAWRDIHRRVLRDGQWSAPAPLGLADQAGVPAVLANGRVVLPFVDRFGTGTICVATANGPEGIFGSPLVLHRQPGAGQHAADAGALLAEMGVWSFGLPCAAALQDGSVMVLWYAGTPEATDIRFARLDMKEGGE